MFSIAISYFQFIQAVKNKLKRNNIGLNLITELKNVRFGIVSWGNVICKSHKERKLFCKY